MFWDQMRRASLADSADTYTWELRVETGKTYNIAVIVESLTN